MATAPTRIRVLGPLTVEVGGSPVALGGRIKRPLLADLALHPNQVLAVDRLVEDLWPATPPRDAANTLQVHVGQLRRLLEPERKSRQAAAILVSGGGGYALHADEQSLDAIAFEAAIDHGRRLVAANRIADAASELRRGLALWRGEPVPEIADLDFAAGPVARLGETRLAALELCLELELGLGHHAAATAELEALTRAYPLRERLWELLMLALHRSGRSAEALRAFQRISRMLDEDLGVRPSTRLVELDRAIATDDPTLAWTAPTTAAAPVAAARPHEDPVIGRGVELGQLLTALDGAAAGARRVVFLIGDAGAGKTRLLAELAERAWAQGARVVSTRCSDGEAPPLGPVVEILAQLLQRTDPAVLSTTFPAAAAVAARLSPTLRQHLGPLPEPANLPLEEERTRLFDAVAQLIAGAVGATPTVIVVDDVHWADPTAMGMLHHAACADIEVPLLLALGYRPSDIRDARVHRTLKALGRDTAADEVVVGPLDDEDATDLVVGIVGAEADESVVEAIVARSGGNPFFLRELACEVGGGRIAAATVPAAASELVLARLSRLDATARELALTAAVFEGRFALSVAATVAGLEHRLAMDALDVLINSGLVVPETADECAFTHDLVREALYVSLSEPRRARMHRAIADALEATALATTPAAVIAGHYRKSATVPGTSRGAWHAERAASAAEAAHAYAEAADMLELALELGENDEIERGRLLMRLGRARLGGDMDESAAVNAFIVGATALAATDPTTTAATLADAANFAISVGAMDAARQLADAGLTYAEEDDNAWGALKLVQLLAAGVADPSWPGVIQATPETEQVAAALRRTPPARRPSMASTLLLAFRSRRDVVDVASDDPAALVYWAGEYERALPLTAAMAQQCEDDGRIELAIVHRCTQSRCLNALGRFADADDSFERIVTLLPRLSRPSLFASHVMTVEEERWAATGQGWSSFRVDVRPHLDPRVERWYASVQRAATARVLANLGANDAALEQLEQVLDAIDTTPAWAENYLRIVHAAAETLWLAQRTDHVDLIERNAREKLLDADFRYPMTDIRLTIGRLAALGGRLDEALDWFARARAVLNEQGAQPLAVVTTYDAATVEDRLGHHRRAEELWAEVARQARALAMTGWAAAADRALASRRPSRPPRGGPVR